MAGTDRSNVVLIEKERYPEGSIIKSDGIFGKFGNNYPEHMKSVNFLGLTKTDLVSLAFLGPGSCSYYASFHISYSFVSFDNFLIHNLFAVVSD